MDTVTVSSKFQVVIPSGLRRLLNILAAQKLTVRFRGNHIELIPDQPISAARGFLPGLDTQVER